MQKRKLVYELARKYGYKLIRSKKHLIWQHSITGAIVTTAKSASDHRAMKTKKNVSCALPLARRNAFGASAEIHFFCPDEPGAFQTYYPRGHMTQTVSNTEPTAQEAPETAIDDLSQFNSGNTYDPAGNSELDDVRVKLNSRPLDDRWVSAIRAAAGKKHFPLELQFEVADMSKAVTFTLGELAATAEHERAIQYIYPKRVDHVLFGPHGIARGHKLSNDIQLAWRRRLDGELEPYPCITSGRHRLTAIIMLLQHLGIPLGNATHHGQHQGRV